jgi:superfamily II DNA/RNA helicase
LILAPTRELADQVAENVKRYSKYVPLRSAVVFGGVDIHPQIAELRKGVEVVIATPGRLLDHVQQKSVNLSNVKILVLDEADRMLDMGFLPDLQRIINLLPTKRQNLMFSATFSNEIQKLAKSFMREPVLIETARRNATSENIQQVLFTLQSVDDKRSAVSHLIRTENLRQVIVFSNTKIGASRLARQLEKEGIPTVAIHGDKTQGDRIKALDAFKAGDVVAMVATDVAARGLDIAELPCVINFDLPHSPEDYVHRIGRTGRAGASGIAYSLKAPGDERYLADIENLIKKPLEKAELQGFEKPVEKAERPAREHAARTKPQRESASRSKGSRESHASRDGKPLRFDEEFERLRSQLHVSRPDDLFNRPYNDGVSVDHRDDQMNTEIVTRSANKSSYLNKPTRAVPALLGGGLLGGRTKKSE